MKLKCTVEDKVVGRAISGLPHDGKVFVGLIDDGPFTAVAFWLGAEPTVRFSLSPEAREALRELLNNPEAGEPEVAFPADAEDRIVLEWRVVADAPPVDLEVVAP